MKFLSKLFPDVNEKVIKKMQPIVDDINNREEGMSKLSEEELKEKTSSFKQSLKEGKSLDEILPEAFTVMREAAKRVLEQRHYDVQLIGGIVLHRGEIAEMKTGEGKTLVATLPLYLNALEGKGAHLITVNDYLARVGAGWMAPLFHFLGITTGVIIHDAAYIYDPEYSDESQFDDRLKHFRKVPRREAYYCDVTYGTNNEFGFDYLRDNMAYSLSQTVQRDLHYAIVDEIDSILIDEARTPLIISAPAEESGERYSKYAEIVKHLEENEHYNVDEKMKAVTLTEDGISKAEELIGMGNIYVEGGIKEVHHLEQALKARVLFQSDKDYVVREGEIIIVDEFTGRMMPGRRYSEGLHQAIEAKEGVEIKKESKTMANITFQNLFRMYNKLSGMTGTAATEAEEFHKIYNLETIVIPTNKPNIRKDHNDLIYRTEMDKYRAVIRDIKDKNEKGQPILVGTISIEKNELLAEMMQREGLKAEALNAKNHQREAEIIAQAGKRGSITLATNMAGRGVDIVLGGNPFDKEEQEAVKEIGGLHVIGTERHESRRIDNQLRGRAARQGDPGSTQFFVSTEDDLMRIFGGDRMKNLMNTMKVPEDMPIENKMISNSIENAQKKVEGNNFDMRKHLVEYDDVINKHRMAIYQRRREIVLLSEEENSEEYNEENKEEEITKTVDNNENIDNNKEDNKEDIEEKKEEEKRTLSDIVLESIYAELKSVVYFHTASDNTNDWNIKEISEVTKSIWTEKDDLIAKFKDIINTGEENKNKNKKREEILDYLYTKAKNRYEQMTETFSEAGLDFKDVEKGILLRSIDQMWVDHLETIDYLRKGIGLRGYGQRDPLVEYKKEAYHLFHELNGLIDRQVVYSIYKTGDALVASAENQLKMFSQKSTQNLRFNGAQKTMEKQAEARNTSDLVHEKAKNNEGEKVGRNDLCPCGSGKKYKKCCGK
ncbi:MAG: preprotein translocase subunit SecA [Patescibacteria group bacterium]|jgi:preprotein translocase subunit SecA|nr:preprotein translocase subunit SecA [Patescibacteria group bacterium]